MNQFLYMIKGNLYIISAPSGTGKSTLIKELIKQNPYKSKVSISYTTRPNRPGEINGKHYFFISQIHFQKMIIDKKFLEYSKVFDYYYGTHCSFINKNLLKGIDIFLNIDYKGANIIKNKIPNSYSIFILPPSKRSLYQRLYKRNQDSKLTIINRCKLISQEISYYIHYDYLILNKNFKKALFNLQCIIYSNKLKLNNQIFKYKTIIDKLLLH